MKNLALSLALLTLLALPAAAHAQPGRPGGDHDPASHIVPPGTWWRDPNVVSALSLNPDQQKKLDSILLESRITLVRMHASLEEEQLKLEPLLSANPVDQARAQAEISKVADLRAELEKTDGRMLLSLRAVLTPDQWTKLQAMPRPARGGDERRGRDQNRGAQSGRGPGMPPPPPGNGGPNGAGAPVPPGGPDAELTLPAPPSDPDLAALFTLEMPRVVAVTP